MGNKKFPKFLNINNMKPSERIKMETAIKKAMEGGYPQASYLKQEIFLLDPLFWQALGKGCGWTSICNVCRKIYVDECFINHVGQPIGSVWKYNWHRFIDHLAEGKDAESFFTSLLETK